MNGILNILKSPGMTSHDVVSCIRKITGIKRVGHAGTLDPEAAGVLPICVGPSTRLIQYLDHQKKMYRAEMCLGVETDTQDLTGEIINTNSMIPSEEKIKNAIHSFLGEYDQIPPMYSAIKQNGKKLYELAREGKIVERKVKKKHIFSIDWISFHDNKVLFDIVCSEGTYIRTFCHDVGQRLGCGASMSFLLRKESCRLKLCSAHTMEEITQANDLSTMCTSLEEVLDHLPALNIDASQEQRVKNGNSIPVNYIHNHGTSDMINTYENNYYRLYFLNKFHGIGYFDHIADLLKFKLNFKDSIK
ncbi:tRNA pseudouridine(55) synthase TruB [Tindallia californiensis]|uniref:tRNA pseudouridine synthase B n=1 Tax=Tindallia californiensis TaxID=159292 RepID=A0A1H3NP43_9FIRM|nr:tRNA pseudouridine(55) synthase TruB [Tindallia californiensis]SDY90533.1 tRNA pseudouridine synthase B [Tindallia californiensis]